MRPQVHTSILYHVFYDMPIFGIRIHFKYKKCSASHYLYDLFTLVLSPDIGY